MEPKMVSRIAAVAMSLMLVATAPAIPVSAAELSKAKPTEKTVTTLTLKDVEKNEITSKLEGKKVIDEFSRHLSTEYGIKLGAKDIRVFDLSKGLGTDLVMVPVNVEDLMITDTKTSDDKIQTHVKWSLKDTGKSSTNATPTEAGEWDLQQEGCFSRKTRFSGFMDSCFKINKWTKTIRNRFNQSRDAWAMHHWGSGKSKWWYDLTNLSVWSSKKRTSDTMEWADWQPKSDYDENCESLDLPFTIAGQTISQSFEACDHVTIHYSDTEPGAFQSNWDGIAYHETREIGYGVEVMVAPGKTPRWDFGFNFTTG